MQIAPTAPRPAAAKQESRRPRHEVFPVRERVLALLDAAAEAADEAERRRLLTFVVLGAGRGGVALAGGIAELLSERLDADRRLDPSAARVVLVDQGLRVLPGFRPSLSSLARDALKRLGVELRLGVAPSEADAEGIVLAGKPIPSATVLWAEGGDAAPGLGRFAPVCRGFAVAEIGGLRLSGSVAWMALRVARMWTGAKARGTAVGLARLETARRSIGKRARGAQAALACR